jgi:hypothetical protein
MPDDHSEVVPLLPIPNRTVKRLCADDSAGSRVKVGHRQASIPDAARLSELGGICFYILKGCEVEWCVLSEVFQERSASRVLTADSRLRHNLRLR